MNAKAEIKNRVFAVIWALAILIVGTVDTARAAPTVRFKETSIILRDGKKVISLADVIDPFSFYETLHSVSKRDGDYYIVYGSSELSRGGPARNGHCGAGIESFIRWLHGRDGKIVEQQEGLFESCWKNRFGGTVVWKDGKLCWEAEGSRVEQAPEKRRYVSIRLKWLFDPARPTEGIAETESTLDLQEIE